MPLTFTWFPDVGGKSECSPKVSAIKFGDGYEQRVPNGINTLPENWTLTFTRTNSESLEILAFLKARGGHESFAWTNPNGEAGTYVCRNWTYDRKNGEGVMQVSCLFEQVYE